MADAQEGGVSGWVVDVIEAIGEPGVGLLMALENILPPIPSEVVLPFAGFSASQGRIDPVGAWVAATAGALVGAYVLYGIGALVGYDTLHRLAGKRWFVLFGQRDLARGERLFDRHGGKIVLFGRCIPLVRSVVSVPAGLTRMPLWRFTALTVLGSGLWNALFLTLGYRLGERFAQVEQYVKPIGYVVLAALLAGVVVLALRRRRRLA